MKPSREVKEAMRRAANARYWMAIVDAESSASREKGEPMEEMTRLSFPLRWGELSMANRHLFEVKERAAKAQAEKARTKR